MTLDPQELAERLLKRCAPLFEGSARALLEDAVNNDTPDALIDLLLISARNDDLWPEEVDAGLELAQRGIFRQSGPAVIFELTNYKRTRAA